MSGKSEDGEEVGHRWEVFVYENAVVIVYSVTVIDVLVCGWWTLVYIFKEGVRGSWVRDCGRL